MTLTFDIPWAALCSDNRKYVTGYILSKEYRDSKTLIGALSMAAARKHGWPCTDDRMAMTVTVREPDRRRRDLNWSKNLKDGITAGGAVWHDDHQVRDERWVFDDTYTGKRTNAGATVTITLLPTLDRSTSQP